MKAPVKPGEIISLSIEGVSHQGWGVGRFLGFTVFVPGALPGETVEAEVSLIKKNYASGLLKKVLSEAAGRVVPRCEVFDRCGGCQLQHAEYSFQLEMKRKTVQDALSRIARMPEVPVHPVLGMEEPWGYRNRVQFHVSYSGKSLRLGFFETGTHQVVQGAGCHLVPEIFNRMAYFLEKELSRHLELGQSDGNQRPLKHVVFKTSRSTGETAVIFVTGAASVSGLDQVAYSLVQAFPGVVSVMQNINTSAAPRIFGSQWRLLAGQETITDKIGDLVFSVSPPSFVQINPVQVEVLYRKVLEYAELKGTETVIDIYCGIGTISLFLARQASRVYGVEEVEAAVDDAKKNAALNDIKNCEFQAGKAEEVLPRLLQEGICPDVAVVDPPRKGCAPEVLDAITKMKPSRIIYVSCDPGTLARDLRVLNEKGYSIKEVQPVDMFAQTVHVETVVMMSRVEK